MEINELQNVGKTKSLRDGDAIVRGHGGEGQAAMDKAGKAPHIPFV
ncbi:hypothetical protein KSZ_64060 [Dictyobacter formicarum]|uniref:Uncharacterized protein n=1 Tax=Dictyobacter formicarum TaxID=2778368 RepID=A0ABQ3VR24_9CHLR|nr:hypothetical protein KSZ_64060 [Dictyobacter formicarum]